MSNEQDDDLGIVEDLNEKKDSMDKEKLKIIVIGLLLITVIGYMLYSTFKPKKEIEKKVTHQKVNIQKREFNLPKSPPVTIPVQNEKPKELPMTPFGEDEKPKPVFHVNKNTRGSIINFNTRVKKEPKENTVPNQIDVNFYGKKSKATTPKTVNSKTKNPTMYTGGDYAIAGVSRQDPNLSLAKGAYIECTMLTRIVSSYSGNTKCVTSEDIYSTNGVTLLMEKGSTVTGHFKGGNMENGVDRLFVIWDEIRTPNNVVVNIASHATGQLGATGMDGYVDNHWGMRFGAAVMVSILDIGFEVAKNEYMNNSMRRNRDANISYVNQNYTRSASPITNMANTALSQFINIKPTFYKNQGDVVGIYVEKDLDFSKVYRLK